MAKIILSSSAVVDVLRYESQGEPVTSYSVALFQSVIPSETIEARTVADILAAVESYSARAAETGKPGESTAIFPRQAARKPAGFDAAKRSGQFSRLFNVEGL